MLLCVKRLTKRFGGVTAVQDLDFIVTEGQIAVVIGPNGAGKTTLFNLISGMSRPDGGTIEFDGRDVTGFSPAKLAKAGVARTFQNIRLFESLTVWDHLLLGAQRVAQGLGYKLMGGGLGLYNRSELNRNAAELVQLLDLEGIRNELATILPYGVQRRVELARALASQPRLLLLDEPTAGMLPKEAERMTALLHRVRKQQDLTMIIIEHNMDVVKAVADHVTVLHQGQRIAEGNAASVLSDPLVVAAYLGRQRAVGISGT